VSVVCRNCNAEFGSFCKLGSHECPEAAASAGGEAPRNDVVIKVSIFMIFNDF
jgi:hypothetical protein